MDGCRPVYRAVHSCVVPDESYTSDHQTISLGLYPDRRSHYYHVHWYLELRLENCQRKMQNDVYNYTDPRERTKFGIMLQGGTAIYSNVPTVLLIILTTLIIIKLFQHRRKRRILTQRPSSTNDQGGKITAMLIGIVIAYIILILPITVLHNTAYQKRVKAFTETSSGFSLFTEVVQLMEQLNYCLNFFLYIMTSRQFRETLFQILTSKCHCKRTTEVELPIDTKRTRY